MNTNNTRSVQKRITLYLRMMVSSSRNVGKPSNLLMTKLKIINVNQNSLHVMRAMFDIEPDFFELLSGNIRPHALPRNSP